MRVFLGIAALAAAAAAVATGCGPSFQAVYEGDQRFEHCYAVDESPSVPRQDKATCWRDWMKHYTYGQTKDRVEYASSRHYALTSGDEPPVTETMVNRVRRHRVTGTMLVPGSMHEIPPSTMPVADAGAVEDARAHDDPRSHATIVRPPGSECQEACTTTWNSCKSTCKAKACDACDRTHSQCAMGCYANARRDAGPR